MGKIIYYLTRYYSSTGSAAAALIVSIKQPPLSLSVSNYAIIGFLLSSTQLRKTLDFCYHESVTHAGMSSYGRPKIRRILWMPSLRGTGYFCNRYMTSPGHRPKKIKSGCGRQPFSFDRRNKAPGQPKLHKGGQNAITNKRM